MAELRRLRARNWKGQTFEETLSPLMIFHGPNGTGKTSRLEAIKYALAPPTGKQGFAPFMSESFMEIAVGTDAAMVVRTCERIDKGKTTKFTASHRFEPSAGEKSLRDVNARVDDVFALQPFVLDLDGWASASAPDRRRQLLALLGPLAQRSDIDVVAMLRNDAATDSDVELDQMLSALPSVESMDPLDVLQKIEAMAKARLSSIADEKKGLMSRARSEDADELAEAPRPADELEAIIQTLDEEIEEGERQNAATSALRSNRERLEGEVRRYHAALPDEIRDAEDRSAALVKMLGALEGVLAGLQTAAAERLKTQEEQEVLHGEARSRAADFSRKISRLETLSKQITDEDRCPLCRSEIDASEVLASLAESREAAIMGLREAEEAEEKAARDHADARIAHRTAGQELDRSRQEFEKLKKAEETFEPLAAAEEALKGLDEGGLPEVDTASLRARREAAQEEIRASVAHSERRKAAESVGEDLEALEAAERQVRAIVAASGPKMGQGQLLADMVGPITETLNGFSASGRTYDLRLFDERGNPDAMLVLGDSSIHAMSGGERAVGLAALATAVANLDSSRTSCLLIEAGEIDVANLTMLCLSLEEFGAANVVIATHTPAYGTPMEAADAWDVRELLA